MLTDNEKKIRRAAKIKEAVKQHRKEALEGGKSTLNVYVDKETAEALRQMKIRFDLNNLGDVIDILAKAEMKRIKTK